MAKKIQLLDAEQADLKLTRLAYEIYEQNSHEKSICLAGIDVQGYEIAKLLKKKLEKIGALSTNMELELIRIMIDKSNPIEPVLSPDYNATGQNIIVVDDVANSGKTMLFALKPFLQVVPKKIQIAVLVDRKHKRFPIASDFIGMQVSTTLQEQIVVEVVKGKVSGAYLI